MQSHLANPDHQAAATRVRALMATYKENEDLIAIGAYQRGVNAQIDHAIALKPAIDAFLGQARNEIAPWQAAVDGLKKLAT